MMLAAKHIDPVVGVDVHFVVVPPVPVVPIPHPHVGFILDLKELANGAKAVLSSMVMSFVVDQVTEMLEKDPELKAKADAMMAKAAPMVDGAKKMAEDVKKSPLVGTMTKLKKMKEDMLGANQGGSSNRPIFINGIMRATSGTRSRDVPGLHFPLGTGFSAPDPAPSKDAQSFMGSKSVIANAYPLSYMALPATSCWSVGLPPPPGKGDHTDRRHLSLPTSVMLPIPMGRKVLVGGAPTLNAVALILSLFKAFQGSKLARKLADKLKLKSGFVRCVLLKAEPVDASTGEVVVEQNDFTVEGRLPLVWDRYYAGNRQQKSVLGRSWRTLAETQLSLMCYDGGIGAHLTLVDRETAFDAIPLDEGWDNRIADWQYGHQLYREGNLLWVQTKDDHRYAFPLPADWLGQLSTLTEDAPVVLSLSDLSDLDGNGWRVERDGGNRLSVLREYTDSLRDTGRELVFKYKQWLGDPRLYPYQGDISRNIASIDLIYREGELLHQRTLVSYQYDTACRLIAVNDSLMMPYLFEYDERHQMVRHTDRNGLSFYYAYQDFSDGVRRVTRAWGDGGLFDYQFDYDLLTFETIFTDSLGHRSVMQCDERGYPVAEINAAGEMTAWKYDDCGRTCAEIDPMGRESCWEYDANGNLLSETLPDRSTIQTTYNDRQKPLTFTDQAGGRWCQTWDEHGHLLSQTTPEGVSQRFVYAEDGQLCQVTDSDGAVTTLAYNGLGFLTEVRQTERLAVQYRYDWLGNVDEVISQDGLITRYSYDGKDRLIAAILPSGSRVDCEYDAEDNLLTYQERLPDDSAPRITRFSYFGQGELHSRTEPDGSRIVYDYDTECQLVGVRNQSGQRWQLHRDEAGRLKEEVDYWGRSRRYQYDASGYLTGSINPLGHVLAVSCDKNGRIISKGIEASDGSEDGEYSQLETFSYSPTGQLIQACNAAVILTREYNKDGQLLREQSQQQRVDGEICYQYDGAGRLLEQRQRLAERQQSGISLQQSTRYGYNALGQVSTITQDQQPPTVLDYTAQGYLSHVTQAGLSTHYHYNANGQRSRHEVLHLDRQTTKVEYFYDASGNLTERRDSRNGSDRYRYDLLGQVLSHQDPLGGVHHYVYDRCGNRFQVDELDDGRRVTHANGVVYEQDLSGQVTQRRNSSGQQRYQWDSQGRLVQVTTDSQRADYQYDPLGRRIAKTVSDKQGGSQSRWFLWDGDRMVGELQSAVDTFTPPVESRTENEPDRVWHGRFYHYLPNSFEPLHLYTYQFDNSTAAFTLSQRYHYENDPNGMPLRLYDSEGDVVWSGLYSIWGHIYPRLSPFKGIEQSLRLQGQYFDSESGLHYNRHRYYDPETGVFISQDPIGLRGGLNPYQFAVNTLTWIDPLGLECQLVTKTRELAKTVSDKFKKIFQCDKFANALKKKMQKEGIAGEHLVVKTGSNKGMLANIWSDAAGKNISTNGIHEAIKVGDTVFDNMNPSGISYSSWAGDLFSPGGHSISSTGF